MENSGKIKGRLTIKRALLINGSVGIVGLIIIIYAYKFSPHVVPTPVWVWWLATSRNSIRNSGHYYISCFIYIVYYQNY